MAEVDRRRGKLVAYAQRRGVQGPKHWLPDDHAKRLASKHGRTDEYLDLLITHQFVHGSTLATSQRYSQGDDETVIVGGPAADLDSWTPGSALSAAYSTLHAARSSCRIFGWPEPEGLAGLFAEVEARSERRQ